LQFLVSEESAGPLGRLPPNWEEAHTETGGVYFFNRVTQTSQWADPRLNQVQNVLPFGWEQAHDPQVGTYYYDRVNKRSQFEKPVQAATKSAGEFLPLNLTGN